MLLLGLIELICLVGIPVTLVGFAIQAIRKKQNKKVWGGTCIGLLAAMVACVIITPTSTSDNTSSEPSETTLADVAQEEAAAPTERENSQTENTAASAETEKSEAEKFAEDNGISVELAESIEAALADSAHSYKLHQVYNWTQIDDWANGERYTGWLDMEYIWVFYVGNGELQSIRQQKDLSYIWSAEGQEAYATTEDGTSAHDEAEETGTPAFSAKELYEAGVDYIGKEVTVQGTILEISEFSDMNGYYLHGTKGQGLVVWVYETEKSYEIGESVTLIGIVQNAGGGQVEITVNAPQ